jgi:uncharacterized protein
MKNSPPREFQVFTKPVGAECNLNCRYCYYLEKGELYKNPGFKRMTYDILEKYIARHIEASTEKNIFFSWHGGEPTLAGLDFFRKVVNLERKHQPHGHNIINGIQTNATLLDDEFCRFLAGENFFVGVSIDGPEQLHNKFRISKDKSGSFKKALKGYELLKKHNVTTEILTVVNSENVNFPLEVYRFIRLLESEYITFLPLVQRDPVSDSGATGISVPSLAFGSFLTTVFDDWVSQDIGKIKIQIIEEAARTAFNQEHTLCIFKKTCGGVPVVEYNGDFYSCDHFVDEEHLVGNINERSLSEMLDSPEQRAFGMDKLNTLPEYCLTCEVRDMCNGECPKNRFINSPAREPGLNYLCRGYKTFFNHIRPFVDAIAKEWNQKNNS